jgi:hypothetical protein
METATLTKKRKNIDIPTDTFRRLSIRAAADGKSLKSYIEYLLVMEANCMSDEELYGYLAANKPDGNVYLDAAEQQNFENWLGI